MSATGKCACGGVRYLVQGSLRDVYNCHRGRCRRFAGGHIAATAAHRDDVTFYVEHAVVVRPGSGVEYGFGSVWDSALFWRFHELPERLYMTTPLPRIAGVRACSRSASSAVEPHAG